MKYQEGDCRVNSRTNNFSPFGGFIKDTLFTGKNRKERRTALAVFRRTYGREAYNSVVKMKGQNGLMGSVEKFLVNMFEGNKEKASKAFAELF